MCVSLQKPVDLDRLELIANITRLNSLDIKVENIGKENCRENCSGFYFVMKLIWLDLSDDLVPRTDTEGN